MSIGNLACRPNIKNNGVLCMVVLNDVLSASYMNRRASARHYIQYCCTPKAWDTGSNLYAHIRSYLADDRA